MFICKHEKYLKFVIKKFNKYLQSHVDCFGFIYYLFLKEMVLKIQNDNIYFNVIKFIIFLNISEL